MSPKYSLFGFTENIFYIYIYLYVPIIGQYHFPSLYHLHITCEGPELLTVS
jgi:hypothetical protein